MHGTGRPVWDDLAAPEDHAALQPPHPEQLSTTPDVLVVGGGVIGLAVAATCTRAGMDVLLVEREGRLAMHSSGRAAGGLAPDAHPELGEEWRALARRSLDRHRELDAEWGYGFRDADLLVLPDFVIEGQAHVDPLRFCAALARRAGTIVTGCAYDELVGVRPAHTVFVTGPVPDVVGQSWVKGHLLATEPTDPLIDGIIASVEDDLLFLQLPSGRIVAGGTKEPQIERGDVDAEIVGRITRVLARIRPAAADLEVTHRWTCFRPHIAGDLPLIGRVSGRDDAWFAGGFYSTGVLMAPVTGELVLERLTGG